MRKVHAYLNEIEADRLMSEGKYEEAVKLLEGSIQSGEYIDRQSVYRNLSVCYMTFREFKKARDCLEAVLRDGGDATDPDTLYNLAFCYYSLEDHRKALELFERITALEGPKTDTSFNRGMSLLALGDPEAAMKSFLFLAENDAEPSLVYNAGISLIGSQEPALAVRLFVSFLRAHPNDLDATYGLGVAYGRNGEDQKAIECLERVIKRDPRKFPGAYVSLAISYFQIGEVKASVTNLDQSLRLDPEMADAWFYRGFVYESAGQAEKAADCYRKSVEIDPRMTDGWQRLGQMRLRENRLEEALGYFKKVFQISPESGAAYRIALILIAEKKYSAAIEYLLVAADGPEGADLRLSEVFENLAVCFYYTEDFARALENGELTPPEERTPFLLFILGSSAMKTGSIKKARFYFGQGLERSPEDMNILYGMGVLEGSCEKYDLSENYLKKALHIQRNPDIIYALALTEVKLGKSDLAAELFAEYRKANPDNADIQYKMGLFFIELKKFELAREAFRETLRLRPENKKARDYLLSLK